MTLPRWREARKRIILGSENDNHPTMEYNSSLYFQQLRVWNIDILSQLLSPERLVYVKNTSPVSSDLLHLYCILAIEGQRQLSNLTTILVPPSVSVDLNMSDAYAREE